MCLSGLVAAYFPLKSLERKMYGPQGIGALYISDSIYQFFPPFLQGGGQQDRKRAGTVPVALCHGFGLAAEKLATRFNDDQAHTQRLQKLFLSLLLEAGVSFDINGSLVKRHSGNLNVCFESKDAESLLMSLQPHLAASTGSACHGGFIGPSHVLLAIGLNEQKANSSVRFSFGRYTTENEIKQTVNLLKEHLL